MGGSGVDEARTCIIGDVVASEHRDVVLVEVGKLMERVCERPAGWIDV